MKCFILFHILLGSPLSVRHHRLDWQADSQHREPSGTVWVQAGHQLNQLHNYTIVQDQFLNHLCEDVGGRRILRIYAVWWLIVATCLECMDARPRISFEWQRSASVVERRRPATQTERRDQINDGSLIDSKRWHGVGNLSKDWCLAMMKPFGCQRNDAV